MANIKDWNFINRHVDPLAMTQDGSETGPRGNYISSESIVLCSAPGTFNRALESALTSVIPIGVCDTVQVMQNKNVVQLYEIGSRIPYIIPGRAITQFQISRVLFNGDSLLAALTAGNMEAGLDPNDYSNSVTGEPGSVFNIGGADQGPSGRFFMNLASHFFNNPFGLAMFYRDSENQWVGGFYAENAIIQQHSMAIQGQNMVVMENALVRCTNFLPMQIEAVS